jgi:hypothetical protein
MIGYDSERSDMAPTTKKNRAAQSLGRLGGQAGTKKQNAARKQNAQLAGRPRRVCTTCGEPVVGGHVDRRLDDSCGAHGWRWQQKRHPPTVESLREQIEAHHRAIVSLEQQLATATIGALHARVGDDDPDFEARALAVLRKKDR